MFDLDSWQEIYHTLKSNKLRTFLTAFGVFWGIFMLVIMLGSGRGLENGVYEGMGDFATNSVFMWAQPTSMPYKGFDRGRRYNFNNDDTKAIRREVSEIKYLAPRLQAFGGNGENNVVRNLKSGAFSILGDVPEFNKIDPVEITNGRFLNELDLEESRKVLVIGKNVFEALFEADENPINQYIRVNGVYFKIIGTFASKHNQGWGEYQNQSIFMPFTTLQKTYNYGSMVGHYSVTAKAGVSASLVEKKVKNLLKKRHHVHPNDERAIGSNNVEEEFNKINGLFNGIAFLVWIVGTGTLIAGVIGVSNIMLVIIKERTKEIGIQRAIGATPNRIIKQILAESVVLTGIAGSVGLLAGIWLLELIDYGISSSGGGGGTFSNPTIDIGLALTALVILITAGMLSGLIPAKRAVSIKPIDALRSE